ncbi:MAG: arginase family protein, partial [Pseudomonadota bacterium]
THGTPFRRAVEEGLLDPKRVIQIGLRGSMYESNIQPVSGEEDDRGSNICCPTVLTIGLSLLGWSSCCFFWLKYDPIACCAR